MFRTFRRSWNLVKLSWELLMQDRELLTFPLLSMLGTIIVSVFFGIISFVLGIPQALAAEQNTTTTSMMSLILTFLYFFSLYIVVIYTKVAITGAVLIRLNGGDPTVNDGFNVATSLLSVIIPFAAINAFVSLLTSLIRGNSRKSNNFAAMIIGSIVAGLIDGVWAVATYLVVPVMVVEKVDAIAAIKRSGTLVQDTWGRQLAGSVSMGGVFGLITFGIILISLPLFAIAISANSAALLILVVVLLVLAIMGVSLVAAALDSIYRLALYRYAHDKKVEVYSEDILEGAFLPSAA